MSIIVFLVDTSASMNQTTHSESGRQTFLDIAKKAVEMFIKDRQKYFASSRDKYMLLTFDEPPDNIKATCRENVKVFYNKLNLLDCTSMTTVSSSLRNAYDTLNLLRTSTGIDYYGHGRFPFSLQPATIILITDGGKLSTANGVQVDLTMPTGSKLPGSSYSKEIYRWDQRLYAVVLRLPGTFTSNEDPILPSYDESDINYLCEKTGGRSFSITSHNMILRTIQYIVFNIHQGFFCRFEKIRPNILDSHKLVHLVRVPEQRNRLGIWPIPETYSPNLELVSLPPRDGHPVIKYNRINKEPEILDNFPIDEYSIDRSLFSKFMLSCANPIACWNVFIQDKNRIGGLSLFGYLKADKNKNSLKLHILCYNYSVFMDLLESLLKIKENPTEQWRNDFVNFLETVPAYYIKPIRMCLRILSIGDAIIDLIVPTDAHIYLHPSIIQLQNAEKKEAKELLETMHKFINEEPDIEETSNIINVTAILDIEELIPPYLRETQDFDFTDFLDFGIETEQKRVENQQFNCDLPNTPRHQLLDHMCNIRYKFFNYTGIDSIDEDLRHNIPINDMGQYENYRNRRSPTLREINPARERKHIFGNPFDLKKDEEKENNVIVDLGSPYGSKRGALPRNLQFKKQSTYLMSPPLSPKRMRRNIYNMPSTSSFSMGDISNISNESLNMSTHNKNDETINVFSQSDETQIEKIEVSVSPSTILLNLEDSDSDNEDLEPYTDDDVTRLVIDEDGTIEENKNKEEEN